MCGVCGFTWQDDRLLERMMTVQAHRGPDGAGSFTDGRVSLGHRRLAIIDLSDNGRQPMANEDSSLWLAFNGEIYNHVELAEELRGLGHTFRSRADSEVILHAYEAWGEECLHRFNGEWGLALYDARRRRLFLARDRYGIKPLHYWWANRRLAFASEIKALLQCPGLERRAHEPAVYDYLVFGQANTGNATFFEDVFALLPGECLTFEIDSDRFTRRLWYEMPLRPTPGQADGRDAVGAFRELFLDAVRLRLTRSDVEVGSCLSGGLDSSSIVCSLAKAGGGRPLNHQAFSVMYPDTPIDESRYLNEAVRGSGVTSHVTTTSGERLLEDIHELVVHQEEPFGAATIFSQWEVMRLARRHRVKVLLDGQGSDEILAGYPFLAGYLLLEHLRHGRLGRLLTESLGLLLIEGSRLDPFLAALWLSMPRPSRERAVVRRGGAALAPEFRRRREGRSDVLARMYAPMDLNAALARRMQFGLGQLLRAEDRNSMAFSVEARVPFLDHRLVEFVFSLAAGWKLRRGTTKHVLREAMKGILPEAIRNRRQKFGFATPFADWLRGPALRQFVRGLLGSQSFASRGFLDPRALQRVHAQHLAGKDFSDTLWRAIHLELWMRKFIDEAPPTTLAAPVAPVASAAGP